MKAILAGLFSFETFFALFLFVNIFKESPRLNWVPVDLTLMSFLASVLALIWVMFKGGFRVPGYSLAPVMSMVLFCAWALLSLLWSPSVDYGVKKAAILTVFGLWSFMGGVWIIGPSRERLKRFCLVIVLLSIWITAEIVILIFSGEILRDLDWGNQYLGQGRLVGLGVLSLVGMFFWGRIGLARGAGLTVLIAVLLTALLILGGRGPFLATILALGVAVYRGTRVTRWTVLVKRNIAFTFLLTAGILIWFFFSGTLYFDTTTLDRFTMLLSVGGEGSANNRLWFFGHAWEYWQMKPILGQGIGSFGILLGWGDIQVYPHNIILEVLAEMGLVGLMLFGLFVFLSTRKIDFRMIRQDPYTALVLMLVINASFNAMVTSDLSGNRVLYAALGLLCGATHAAGFPLNHSGPGQPTRPE